MGAAGRGGALFAQQAQRISVSNSEFEGNSAGNGQGGVVFMGNGVLDVTTSTLGANTPDDVDFEGTSYDYGDNASFMCRSGSGCQ